MIYLGQDPVGVNSVHSLVIDDNAGNGDTGMTWSADKLTAEFEGKLDASEKGAANGVAGLDVNGKIPSSQLPSYVDDVVEYANLAGFPQTGESGKIYVALDTNKTYRWSGSSYVEISQSLALGETSTTAYRGDRGAVAYAAAVTNVENSPTEDSNNLITSGAVYEGLEAKMDFDPEYGREVAGVANKLLSDKYTEENTPYLMRKAFDAEFDEETLVGGTVCWNQLAPSEFKNCRAQKNLYSAMLYNEDAEPLSISISNGHKYLITLIQPAGCSLYKQNVTGLNTPWKEFSAPSVNTRIHLFAEGTGNYTSQSIAAIVTKNETTEDYYAVSDVQVFNLTKMFGPVIADYIYDNRSYETNIGYNWFIEKFPKAYYSYDAGSLQSVQAAAHKMVGFNALNINRTAGAFTTSANSAQRTFDEGKYYAGLTADNWYSDVVPTNVSVSENGVSFTAGSNVAYGVAFPVKCVPNTTYYVKATETNGFVSIGYFTIDGTYIRYTGGTTDMNGTTFTTPSNAWWFVVSLRANSANATATFRNIVANIHCDGERDGEYEPYKSVSYPFNSDLVLRGLPKLDNGRLYYDGDTYNADGTVTRKYGIVDLGTLNWLKEGYLFGDGYDSFYGAVPNALGNVYTYGVTQICSKYASSTVLNSNIPDKSCRFGQTSTNINIYDSALNGMTTAQVKEAMSGVYLVYELATPTTEQADPFTALQKVYQNGTEQFTEWGTRDVEIPVGHLSKYSKDHKAEVDEEISNIYSAKADVEEKYGRSVASIANQVISDQYTENKVPYLMRKAVDAEWDEESLVGGTIAWNQLIRESKVSGQGGTLTVSNGVYTLVPNGNYSSTLHYGIGRSTDEPLLIANHVYFASVKVKGTKADKFRLRVSNTTKYSSDLSANQSGTIGLLCKATTYLDVITVYAYDDTLYTSSDTLTFSNFNLFDLTQMFGSTIADYILALETANADTGIAWFRRYFNKLLYQYNNGELMSVQTSAHRMVGFNQWDEVWEAGSIDSSGVPVSTINAIRSKNFCRILPNTTYYMTCGKTDGGSDNKYYLGAFFYDENKNLVSRIFSNRIPFTTPANAYYFKLTTNTSTVLYGDTYNHDICVNISDTNRNGEYEPYKSTSYPFDDSLTLRGIPKLDSSNNLYYDGDTYNADGTVTRKYEEIASFSRISLDTSGKLYKIATSTDSGFTDLGIRAISNLFPVAYLSDCRTNADNGIESITLYGNSIYIGGYVGHEADLDAILPSLKVVHELATPITESAAPYTLLQNVDRYGTEEFTEWGTRDIQIPVGHSSKYYKDKRRETVTDVQINGTSITTNGVANIPISGNSLGVVKPAGMGVNVSSQGFLSLAMATDEQIKAGIHNFSAIEPINQHKSVFYGLAKLAGVDMASSSNAVGTFTPEALRAIRVMLGLPKYVDWELIYDYTATENLTQINVTTDSNGLTFELRKLIAIFTASASTTGNRDSFWLALYGINDENTSVTISLPSLTYPTATSVICARVDLEADHGMPIFNRIVTSASEGSSQNVLSMPKAQLIDKITGFKIYQSGSDKSLIPSGANLKIYGIRY